MPSPGMKERALAELKRREDRWEAKRRGETAPAGDPVDREMMVLRAAELRDLAGVEKPSRTRA